MQPLHTAILSHPATPRPGDMVAVLLRLGADPLAACPDCYPSYARWKMQRGLHAMQVGRDWAACPVVCWRQPVLHCSTSFAS
jgi:hypothetical protein